MKSIKISLISTDDICAHGVRSISSFLKKPGHHVRLIFMPTFDKQYSKKVLRDLIDLTKGTDLIGVSCMSFNSDKTVQVIKHLKNLKIPIVWGGIHATFNPEECLKYSDFVCIGEGEETMLELVEKLAKKMDVTKIKNLWVKKGCEIYKNDVRPLIQDLDELPFEDYDFETQWVLDNGRLVKMNKEYRGHNYIDSFTLTKKFSRFILVHTTRGCPYSCTYCCNSGLRKIYLNKGNFVRKRSIKNIIEELVELKQKFPSIDFVWFTDEIFFCRSVKEMSLFCKEYKRKIDLPFICNAEPFGMNEAKLKLLLAAGLKRIKVGLQTGSEEINKNLYNRIFSNNDIISMKKIINKYRNRMLPPEYQVIISNPYETEKDVLETIKLLQQLPKPYFLETFSLTFFSGTQLFYKAINDGIINSKKDLCVDISYEDIAKHLKRKIKKLNTVYLYLILTLMQRNVTSSRYGRIPKFLLNNLLLNKKVIQFFQVEFIKRILILISYIYFKIKNLITR